MSNFSLRSIVAVMRDLINPGYSIKEFSVMCNQSDNDGARFVEEVAHTMLTNILNKKNIEAS